MVNARDLVIFIMIALGGLTIFVGVGGLELAGSQTSNIVCQIPGVSSLDYCSASTSPDDEYKVTHGVTVNRNSVVDGSFRFKTEETSSGFPLSFTGSQLSVLGQGENVVLEYYVRDDGLLVASDSRRLGTVETFETEDVLFENKLSSGTYDVEYIVRGDECSVLGCTGFDDKITVEMEVPKLPLGEY